ncbi:MAG: ECF transporter S component [Lachnospiraceae bacterium]|nr:ECF transporter S component [Lachnospiraceae bacterium]
MNETKKKFGPKQIAITAMLLAICIVSQIFKDLSIFITGPIINACIVLAVLAVNLPCGLVLSAITPVTAFFITTTGPTHVLPAMMIFIALGNMVLAVGTQLLLKAGFIKKAGKAILDWKLWVFSVVTAAAKGAFMGATISWWMLPTFLPKVVPAESPMLKKLPVLQTTFSLYQFLTAVIGFVLVFVLWPAIVKVVNGRGE